MWRRDSCSRCTCGSSLACCRLAASIATTGFDCETEDHSALSAKGEPTAAPTVAATGVLLLLSSTSSLYVVVSVDLAPGFFCVAFCVFGRRAVGAAEEEDEEEEEGVAWEVSAAAAG